MPSAKHTVEALEALAQRSDLSDRERTALRDAIALLGHSRSATRQRKLEKTPPARTPSVVDAILWTDGAARGNPGPAGIGALLTDKSGKRLATCSEFIGEATNNVAEYKALLAGLQKALAVGVRRLEVRADSQLLIRQLEGRYRVKNPGLKPLFAKAQELIARLETVHLVHVPREENSEADRLANEGIDSA